MPLQPQKMRKVKNQLGKEKVGDKQGKNKPGRLTRQSTALRGMKGTMRRTYNRRHYTA